MLKGQGSMALCALCVLAPPLLEVAQTAKYELSKPEAQIVDSNGVDMVSGLTTFSVDDVGIRGASPLVNVVQSFNYPNPYATTPNANTGATNGFYFNQGVGGIPQFKTNGTAGMGHFQTGGTRP
jgi:hypothetical protein